jgi:hypothetical protein
MLLLLILSIIDLTDTNSITVNTTGPGMELDDSANFWQTLISLTMYLPEFTSYLSTTKWLRNITREMVVGIPKYFTPNNDSYNDGWELRE